MNAVSDKTNSQAIGPENARLINLYGDSLLLERGVSNHTLAAYTSDLRQFARFLEAKGGSLQQLINADKQDIMDYLGLQLDSGQSSRSSARKLSSLKSFYRFLRNERLLNEDPTHRVEAPRIGRALPRSLTEQDVRQLLAAPDRNVPLGLRDSAMLEMLYACGLRVSELIQLSLSQVNLERGVVRVWGKGSKERMIPTGETAVDRVNDYLQDARPALMEKARTTSEFLFVTRRGSGMTRQAFWYIIKRYAKEAELSTEPSPHTLRHAFATHLVNHDADLRVVQLLLGHSNLSTTQIYTHVARERMKRLHQQHHPRG